MKDILAMAKMLSAAPNETGGESPLSAISDVAQILSSIYEELRKLNTNLETYNKVSQSSFDKTWQDARDIGAVK